MRCSPKATMTAEASTPGIASATTGPRTGRSSAQSIEYAAANTNPGTNTPRTRPGVIARPMSGKRIAPQSPAMTSTTESGNETRRARAASPIATARSATAMRRSAAAVRLVEEIDEVHDADVRSGSTQPALDLHEAAGVRRHDRVRAGSKDVRDLPLEDRAGEVGLGDVVRARAPAAPVRFLERDDLEARDRGEQRAGLLADLLTVEQVTRIVPRDPPLQRPRTLAHPEVAQVFGRVLDLRREGRRAGGPRPIVL